MRKTMLMSAVLVPALALGAYAGQSYEPYGEPYGYGGCKAPTEFGHDSINFSGEITDML